MACGPHGQANGSSSRKGQEITCVAAVGLCRESHSVETFVCQIFVTEERMASSNVAYFRKIGPVDEKRCAGRYC